MGAAHAQLAPEVRKLHSLAFLLHFFALQVFPGAAIFLEPPCAVVSTLEEDPVLLRALAAQARGPLVAALPLALRSLAPLAREWNSLDPPSALYTCVDTCTCARSSTARTHTALFP